MVLGLGASVQLGIYTVWTSYLHTVLQVFILAFVVFRQANPHTLYSLAPAPQNSLLLYKYLDYISSPRSPSEQVFKQSNECLLHIHYLTDHHHFKDRHVQLKA